MRDLDLRGLREGLGPEVGGATHAGGGVIELARLLAREGDQRGQAVNTQRGMDHQHVGLVGHHTDELEVGDAVVGDPLHQGRDHMARGGADQQGVAIRLGPCNGGGADGGGASRAAIHDEGLLQARLELLPQRPRHRVGRAAGRIGMDQGDGALGPLTLCQRGGHGNGQGGRTQKGSPCQAIARCGHGNLLRLCRGIGHPSSLRRPAGAGAWAG